MSQTQIIPSSLELDNMGHILYAMMRLDEIPDSDLYLMKTLLSE